MNPHRTVSRRVLFGGTAAAIVGAASPESFAFADTGFASEVIDRRSVDGVARRLDSRLIALRRDTPPVSTSPRVSAGMA